MPIPTDYLVIGAGASGLAFTDTLVAQADVDVLLVDRATQPGGHWIHAYPFVELHSPSAFYGVDSLALGADSLDRAGRNAGLYERASKPEILAYFADVVAGLEATGRVRARFTHEHLGTAGGLEQVRDLTTGDVHEVEVRRAVVDARYLEASVPATHVPSFEVAADASFCPIGLLPQLAGNATDFVVLGAGKTAVDACLWLLDNDVDEDRIRWVRSRDAWFHDRAGFQPLEQVVGIMEGLAADAEAGAHAQDTPDLMVRLEKSGRMLRLDPEHEATMYRGGMLSEGELGDLRRVADVVRLGGVRRVQRDRLLLDAGELALRPGSLVVDCTARGLRDAPPVPIFAPGRIVLQQVRHNSPPFNAALLGLVEAHRQDHETKNRLCPPNQFASSIHDIPRMYARTWLTEGGWLRDPEVSAWVGGTRLNLLRDLPAHQHEPRAQEAVTRYLTHVGDAITRFGALGTSPGPSAAPARA